MNLQFFFIQTLLTDLCKKESDIQLVQQQGLTLIDSGQGCPEGTSNVMQTINNINTRKADMEAQVTYFSTYPFKPFSAGTDFRHQNLKSDV